MKKVYRVSPAMRIRYKLPDQQRASRLLAEEFAMDVYMSEIIAVIDEKYCADLADIAKRLRDAGVEISSINRDEGVIEGVVDASKVKQIDAVPGVDYVRTVFTYAANFPPGDPRDRDGS